MTRTTVVVVSAALLILLAPSMASGAGREFVGMFDEPVYVASDPGNPDRLFVAERRGVVVEAHGASRAIWADLTSFVLCCDGDRGLLSIAPAPDFGLSGRVYVAYTGTSAAGGVTGDIHVDSFRHSGGALIREPVLTVPHATEPDLNGGQLQFGPDGALYASFGDGGGTGDPFDDAQDVSNLLGKLIRIYPYPGTETPYVVPGDNPFVGTGAFDEIWSYGLRDPRRFSFDRLTEDLVIADRGESAREEINFAPDEAGAPAGKAYNFGWDCREGSIEYPGDQSDKCTDTEGLTDPAFEYSSADPGGGGAYGCSITGGYVVRDASVPDLYGRYLYGDLCTGQVRSIDLTASSPGSTDRAEPALATTPSTLSSFGEDSCGRVYIVTRIGQIDRIVGAQPNRCGLAAPAPPAAKKRRRKPRVGLRALRRKGDPSRMLIKARVRPCVENRGRTLILKRDGRRLAKRRLKGRCVLRFGARVEDRTTFRALLRLGGGGIARSRRVVVHPNP
jgi:glucose/arabinose dehydrogenase